MSIRQKILLIIVCTFGALFLLVYAFSETFLLQRFVTIEEQAIDKDTKRAREAYNDILLDLSTKIHDWSSWDDTYTFIQNKNKAYIASNLNNSSLSDLDINFIVFVDSAGTIVMSKYIAIATEKELPLPTTLLPYVSKESSLLQFDSAEDVQQGVIMLPEGPLFVSARPITKSDHSGPIRGTLIFGRFLDESVISNLSNILHLPLVFQRYNQQLPNDFEKAKTMVEKSNAPAVFPLNDDSIAGFTLIHDIQGNPALLLKITEDRTIYKQGKDTIFTYLLIIGGLGSIICVLLFFNLQRTISELQKAKAKDDAMLESIGDGLLITDTGGTVLLANTVAGRLTGIPTEKMVGQNLFDTFAVYDTEGKVISTEKRPLFIALHENRRVQKEIQIKQHDKKITVGVIATPVMQQGKNIGAIETIRDITKEKALDRTKTEFISLAAHQLRTPLSSIKWFSEMLVDGDAGELKKEQLEFAQNISNSTNRMIDLINSLLNITRVESGRLLVKPQSTDLKKLIESVVKELQIKFEDRKQHILLTVSESVPNVNLDDKLIRQVYANLLTNAIKYSPSGSTIHVAVSVKHDEIVSQISDSGYGIPESDQSKIFDKFFRGDNVAKKETDGTGLGLYLIKSILDSIHGKIWFESTEKKGSTFWFTIPLSGMKPKEGEVTLDS